MHDPHSNQLFILLTYQTLFSAMHLLTSVLSTSKFSESSLQSQPSCSFPRNSLVPWTSFLHVISSSLLSEPIWSLKTTFSCSWQHFLMRLTLTIMKVSVNLRIVLVQRGNKNSRPFMTHNIHNFLRQGWFEVHLISWGPWAHCCCC